MPFAKTLIESLLSHFQIKLFFIYVKNPTSLYCNSSFLMMNFLALKISVNKSSSFCFMEFKKKQIIQFNTRNVLRIEKCSNHFLKIFEVNVSPESSAFQSHIKVCFLMLKVYFFIKIFTENF